MIKAQANFNSVTAYLINGKILVDYRIAWLNRDLNLQLSVFVNLDFKKC